ncbi:MAG: hypothetical protein IPO21_19440 [Bacteroidales bacterium]|nr:hypothetical protein [Bacteroidales bacterium]
MSKLKFPSITLGSLFKRKEYDPTQFQTINEEWDENTSGSRNTKSNAIAAGRYQNPNLPLEQKINLIKQKLEIFDESLPNLKK